MPSIFSLLSLLLPLALPAQSGRQPVQRQHSANDLLLASFSPSFAPSASFSPSFRPSASFAPSGSYNPSFAPGASASPLAPPSYAPSGAASYSSLPSSSIPSYAPSATPAASGAGGGAAAAGGASNLLGLSPAAFAVLVLAILAASALICALGCTVLVLWRRVNLLDAKVRGRRGGGGGGLEEEGALNPFLGGGQRSVPSAPPQHPRA